MFLNTNVLTLIILLLSIRASAQSLAIGEIRLRDNCSFGYIVDQGEYKGFYTSRIALDKDKKKTDFFKLELYNTELIKTLDLRVPRKDNTKVLTLVNNSTGYMCVLMNKESIEYMCFDSAGKVTNNLKEDDLIFAEKTRIKKLIQGGESSDQDIYSFTGKGHFVRPQLVENDKVGFKIESLNSSLEKQWSYYSEKESKVNESPNVLFTTENITGIAVTVRKTMNSTNDGQYFLILDSNTGQVITKKENLSQDGKRLAYQGSFIDKSVNQILVYGEFYPGNDNDFDKRGHGFFIQALDMSGNVVSEKFHFWHTHIFSLKEKESISKLDNDGADGTRLWVYEFFRTSDNRLFAIADEFERGLSDIHVLRAPGKNKGLRTSFRIRDLALLEFDAELNIIQYKSYEKKPFMVEADEGDDFFTSRTSTQVLADGRKFSFAFHQYDPAKDIHYIIYEERLNQSGLKRALDVIEITPSETKLHQRPINFSELINIYTNAKPGHLMIISFSGSKNQLYLDVEKLFDGL